MAMRLSAMDRIRANADLHRYGVVVQPRDTSKDSHERLTLDDIKPDQVR